MDYTDTVGDHIRKGIAAQEAADRAAGRLTATERDQCDLVDKARADLHTHLDAALTALGDAARSIRELRTLWDEASSSYVDAFLDNARRDLAAAKALTPRPDHAASALDTEQS